MIGSLIRQLMDHTLHFSKVKQYAWDHIILHAIEPQGFRQHDIRALSLGAILDMFTDISSLFSTTMLVIDGIDECDIPEERRAILEFISRLGQQPHGSIKILTTSRSILDIKTCFKSFPNVSIAATSTDVKLFVAAELEQRLRSDAEFYGIRIHDPELKIEIISTLVNKANGMFQWVRCQLDTLSRTSGDKGKRKALANLPKDLPDTYRRILDRIDESNRQLARRALVWCSWVPGSPGACGQDIPIRALADLVAHELDDESITERDVLLHCSSLIRLSPLGEVSLSHFSVQEFLTSISEVKSWYYLGRADTEECCTMIIHYIAACPWEMDLASPNATKCSALEGEHPFKKFLQEKYFLHTRIPWGDLSSSIKAEVQELLSQENSAGHTFSLNMLSVIEYWLPEFLRPAPKLSPEDVTNSQLHIASYLKFTSWARCHDTTKAPSQNRPILGIDFVDAGLLPTSAATDRGLLVFEEGTSIFSQPSEVDLRTICLAFSGYMLGDMAHEKFSRFLWALPYESAYRHVYDTLSRFFRYSYGPQPRQFLPKELWYAILSSNRFGIQDMRDFLGIWISSASFQEMTKHDICETTDTKSLQLTPPDIFEAYIRRCDFAATRRLIRSGMVCLLHGGEQTQLLHELLSTWPESSKPQEFHFMKHFQYYLSTITEFIHCMDSDKIFNAVYKGETALTKALRKIFLNAESIAIFLKIGELDSRIFVDRFRDFLESMCSSDAIDINIKSTSGKDARTITLEIAKPEVRDIVLDCLRPAEERCGKVDAGDLAFVMEFVTAVHQLPYFEYTRQPTAPNQATTATAIIKQRHRGLGQFPIHSAITRGSRVHMEETIEALVAAGYDINEPDSKGRTPLHLAIRSRTATKAEILLRNGADVNRAIGAGGVECTPMGLAIQQAKLEHLELLLRHNAERFWLDKSGKTYFHLLVESGNIKTLEIFLANPIPWMDVLQNTTDTANFDELSGTTEVSVAAAKNSSDMDIKFCLEVLAKGLAAVSPSGPAADNSAALNLATIMDQIGKVSVA
ncbi:hypothetical protein ABW19_dt0202176 [Dactylella cylindrospora]|nr:hypothetical protein ABW19_dt0202176 [Dactylella cylindrospora]